MVTSMFCMDTYALVEMTKQSPRYRPYLDAEFVVPESSLAELHALFSKRYNAKTADYWLGKFRPYSRPLTLDIWVEALRHRAAHPGQRLSIIDCLGYTYSQTHGLRFVTGDKEFEGEKGVEFVK